MTPIHEKDGRQGSPMTVSEFPFFRPRSPSSRCGSPSSASVASSDSFSRSLISRFPSTPRPNSPDVGIYDIQRFPNIANGYNREICSPDGTKFDLSSSAPTRRRNGSACFRNCGRTLLDENYAVCPSPLARDRKSFNTSELLDTISFKSSFLSSRSPESKKQTRKTNKSTRRRSVSCNDSTPIRIDRSEERRAMQQKERDILSVRELPFY